MFDLSSYAQSVRDAFRAPAIFWPTCVGEAVESGESDPDRLADLVFFMHHPERISGTKGKSLDPDEHRFSALVEEWVQFRTAILPIVQPDSGETASAENEREDVERDDWEPTDKERMWLKRLGGEALAEWAEIPPMARAETLAFPSPRKDLKGVFAWKSRRPSETCLANPKQRLQLYLAPPESEAYWRRKHPEGNAAAIVAATNKSMNRAYRQHIIRDKMCPKGALAKETETKRELILEMVEGLYGVMPVLGPTGTETVKSLNKLVEAMTSIAAGAD